MESSSTFRSIDKEVQKGPRHMIRFGLYLARWQLSTPILWLVVSRLGAGREATIIANLIGASIFFLDRSLHFRQQRRGNLGGAA